ncbi:MAG: YggT family protein [Candidatus Margulisiibacteriota bacterium]
MIILINVLFSAYYLLIIIRGFLPFIGITRFKWLVDPVVLLTDPVLKPLRLGMPPDRLNGMDFAPFVAIVLLWLLQRWIISLLGGL